MSDARTTPPSFDELVGLIETNFKDVLRYAVGSTPERIEKAWERYKVLNHLHQDSQPPAVKGADLTADEVHGRVLDHQRKGMSLEKAIYTVGYEDAQIKYESPTAAGDGKEAIEFAEWIHESRLIHDIDGSWYYEDEDGLKRDTIKKADTTAQLYDIFKNRK